MHAQAIWKASQYNQTFQDFKIRFAGEIYNGKNREMKLDNLIRYIGVLENLVNLTK